MTVQELYDWAKERNLLDRQISKHFNFSIEDIENVTYLNKTAMGYLNNADYNSGRIVLD